MKTLFMFSAIITAVVCYISLNSLTHHGGENYASLLLLIIGLPIAIVQAVLSLSIAFGIHQQIGPRLVALLLPAISFTAIWIGR